MSDSSDSSDDEISKRIQACASYGNIMGSGFKPEKKAQKLVATSKTNEPCGDWLKGRCQYGGRCRYLHERQSSRVSTQRAKKEDLESDPMHRYYLRVLERRISFSEGIWEEGERARKRQKVVSPLHLEVAGPPGQQVKVVTGATRGITCGESQEVLGLSSGETNDAAIPEKRRTKKRKQQKKRKKEKKGKKTEKANPEVAAR